MDIRNRRSFSCSTSSSSLCHCLIELFFENRIRSRKAANHSRRPFEIFLLSLQVPIDRRTVQNSPEIRNLIGQLNRLRSDRFVWCVHHLKPFSFCLVEGPSSAPGPTGATGATGSARATGATGSPGATGTSHPGTLVRSCFFVVSWQFLLKWSLSYALQRDWAIRGPSRPSLRTADLAANFPSMTRETELNIPCFQSHARRASDCPQGRALHSRR